ncbi:MAG: histidine phosphatase family protein [Prevotella sp.]|nr:histidine phosphatase family protein [Prevotella sp.]
MRNITTIVFSLLFLAAYSQTAKEEIDRNPCKSGSNYFAYPAPAKELTPAPAGKKPFYISHYGRHGSRYHDGIEAYEEPYAVFHAADSAGVLTERGVRLMHNIDLMYAEARDRYGELTPLGAQQHRDIARRMYERFPEIFADSASVDAKSTVVIRCILSMENALLELKGLNPALRIRSDASMHDMYYMNFRDSLLQEEEGKNEATETYTYDWDMENIHPERLLTTLFTDTAFVSERIEPLLLYRRLFNLANIIQDSEIRHTLSLYDLFTGDELFTLWQSANIWWFAHYGRSTLNGGRQPFIQRNLLRKIIEEADSCIALPRPGATLRFGHDTMVLPLACLLDLNGYGRLMHPGEALDNGWYNYRILPMACNIQIIFYRADPDDSDVWIKVLLNEEETTLPITPIEGPYYRWADFKAYYTALLDTFVES